MKLTLRKDTARPLTTEELDNNFIFLQTDIASKASASQLDAKVDKVEGMGLSQESFTTAEKVKLDAGDVFTTSEKTKLAGLESSHFKGTFVDLAALQTGVTSPIAGDYADIDAGADFDAIRYIWDVSDSKWIKSGAATPITAAQVKQLYESNPDTNAFTDTQKTKLAGIATDATKNQTDSYLVNRANHVGQQASSTISDFANAVASKVSQWGLGNSANAPVVNDCNTALTQGVYACPAGTLNAPRSDVYGTLEVSISAPSYGSQVMTSTRGHSFGEKRWFRSFSLSGFSDWFELSKVGDFGVGSKDMAPDVSANNYGDTRFYRSNNDVNSPNLGASVGVHFQRDPVRSAELSLNWLDESLQFRISVTMENRGSWVKVARDSEVAALKARVADLERNPAKPVPTWLSGQGWNTAYAIVNGNLWAACGSADTLTNWGVGRGPTGTTRLFGAQNFSRVNIRSTSKVAKVSSNGLNSLILMQNGELWYIGPNNLGPAGNGTTVGSNTGPMLVNTDVLDVYYEPSNYLPNADSSKSVIRKADGIYVAGYNAYGQLGTGDTVNKTSWTKVWHDGLIKDPAVAAWGEIDAVWNLGAAYGCLFIRTKTNNLFACGYNGNGQLGTGDAANKTSFTDVTTNWGGSTEVAKIIKMLGGYGYADSSTQISSTTYAWLPDGYRVCGLNAYGQFGNGTVTASPTPIKITMSEAASNFVVAGGGVTSCFWIGTSGKLWVWGRNVELQLGVGNAAEVRSPTLHPYYNGTTLDRTVSKILNRGGFNRQGWTFLGMNFFLSASGKVSHMGLTGSYESGAATTAASSSPREVILPITDSMGNTAEWDHITIMDSTTSQTGGCSIYCYNKAGDLYVWGYNGLYGCSTGLNGSDIQLPVNIRPNWA